MAGPAIEKKKIPPKPQPAQAQKKKKKSAPDAPQPKWLFPPDEENPVLNPKARTPEEVQQEREEREKSLDYMKRRVHAVPDRPAPPPELLTLVGIFLTDFGFNSTSRLFTNERTGRSILNGWGYDVGEKIEKGTPTLEQIYRDWYREWKIKKLATDETSSSESGSETSDSDSEAGVKTQVNGVDSSDDDSEASSDGLGGSDVEMKEAPKAKGKKGKAVKKSSRSSSSSSTSDSDADDEKEQKKPKTKVASTTQAKAKKSVADAKITPVKPTVAAMVNKLKRKASSSDEDSDSSESSEEEKPAKKTKTSAKTSTAAARLPASPSDSSSEDSDNSDDSEEEVKANVPTVKANVSTVETKAQSDSSSSESSESESSEEEERQPKNVGKIVPSIPKASSDSSATVNGDVKQAAISSESGTSSSATSGSESSEATPAKKTLATKEKKHTGAKLTPLAELSAKGIQGHVSNQYQSYEYADKAYQDLSVTRGKGFTKEKNKKKRGSYRGGTIDTSGGKAYKFED
jgi:hypothetical protein